MSDARTAEAGPRGQTGQRVPSARRVLVAIDFSDLAAHALPWAYALAGAGGSVVLIHVVDPVTPPNPLYAHYKPGRVASREEREAREAEARERLLGLVPPTAALNGIATEVEVVESSNVAEAIRGAADRLGVDAVCLASRCHGPLRRTILGSIAEALLRAAPIPLFVIPGPRA